MEKKTFVDKEERHHFQCSVLGDIALITIEKRYFHAEDMTEPELTRTDFKNCDNKYDCGIARQPSPGSWTFEWERCPAHLSFNKRG